MSTNAVGHWVPDLSTFAARLAVVRHRMQWNAKEAALACGFPPSSWRNWEAGRKPHDLVEVARAISDRTGVDEVWLMRGGPRAESGTRLPTGEYRTDSEALLCAA